MPSPVADLELRLAALRGAVRRLYAVDGLSRLLLIAAALAGATFLLDWSIPDLPRAVRLFFFLGSFGALAWAAARYLLYPLRRRIADDDLAICVERKYPQLGDRLISAIQLSRLAAAPEWRAFNSPALVDALIGEARDVAARVDFRRVLATRRVRRVALAAALTAAAGIVLAAMNPEYASIWISRLLGGAAKWPRQTYLTVVDPPKYVARGGDCPIVVRADPKGTIPKRVNLHYRFDGGDAGYWRMDAAPNGEFRYDVPRVAERFRFRAAGGDDETDEFTVEVRTAPTLETLVKWYTYPKHVPLENTPADRPDPGGNIKAPVGTEVRLRAVSNEPLASAQIVYASRPDKPEPLKIADDGVPAAGAPAPAAASEGPRRVLIGAIQVRASDEYRIELTAENRLANREPIRFSILAVPDTPPVIRVIEPAADRIATKNAVWPLQIAVTDDYGIRKVRLVWWLEAQGPGPEHAVDFAYPEQNDAEARATKIGSHFPFDLAKTDVKERERVAYRFEAWDFDEAKASKPTQTRVFHFTIWPAAEIEKQVEDHMNRLKKELEKILENEEKIGRNVAGIRGRLETLDALEAAHKSEIAAAALDQRQKVGQRVEGVTRDLQEDVKTVRYNRLLDQSAVEKMERLLALLEGVAKQKSPQASHAIAETGDARAPADRRERFLRALGGIDDIVSDLREALSLMGDWIDYQEIVRRTREIKERQEQLYNLIRDLLFKPGVPEPPKR